MSIKSVLEELYKRAFFNDQYKDKAISQAHSAILAEFEKMLPKEKEPLEKEEGYNCRECGNTSWCYGFNDCLQDIKERIKEL